MPIDIDIDIHNRCPVNVLYQIEIEFVMMGILREDLEF
jgi:hypothetical protein